MSDPDECVPLCNVCASDQATRRIAGKAVCQDCYEDWFVGRWGEDPLEALEEDDE